MVVSSSTGTLRPLTASHLVTSGGLLPSSWGTIPSLPRAPDLREVPLGHHCLVQCIDYLSWAHYEAALVEAPHRGRQSGQEWDLVWLRLLRSVLRSIVRFP